ncbi:MAG: prepilin-type N-terminal cleavage/methylation domain-containing protein [Candidatus Omnitrophota bacterium]|jgi:prepilin-type N-terminal cleavage/methylation domain-containing protein
MEDQINITRSNNRNNRRYLKSGFTLIEILVVVIILSFSIIGTFTAFYKVSDTLRYLLVRHDADMIADDLITDARVHFRKTRHFRNWPANREIYLNKRLYQLDVEAEAGNAAESLYLLDIKVAWSANKPGQVSKKALITF